MTIDDKIKDEKIQEATNTPALSSGKIKKYEYLKVKKYCHLIKVEQQNKQHLNILLSIEHLKNIKKIEEQGKNKLQFQKFYITKKSTVKDGIPENTM